MPHTIIRTMLANNHMSGKYRLRCFTLFSIVLLAAPELQGSGSIVAPEDWDRNFINSGGTAESPAVRFEFTYVFSRQGHLTGEFHLDNRSEAEVQITGIEGSDGKFFPDVVAEVTSGETKADWNWERLVSKVDTGKSVTLTVAPHTVSKPLFVHMDVFTERIGKATYGRLLFTNGRWSMFELSDLMPNKGR